MWTALRWKVKETVNISLHLWNRLFNLSDNKTAWNYILTSFNIFTLLKIVLIVRKRGNGWKVRRCWLIQNFVNPNWDILPMPERKVLSIVLKVSHGAPQIIQAALFRIICNLFNVRVCTTISPHIIIFNVRSTIVYK